MAEPTITFGAAQSFGNLSGWSEQNPSSTVEYDRANVLGLTGNEVASKLHNQRTNVTCDYKANVDGSAPTVPANIGALTNSLILTSISLSTSATDYVSMTLAGHNHTDNAHTSSPALNSVAHSITVLDGFGARDFLGGTAGTDAAVESSTCEITCEHIDKEDAAGNHLVGENYNPRIVATTVWNGVPSDASDATWDEVSVETTTNNQGFLQTTVRGEKALAFT